MPDTRLSIGDADFWRRPLNDRMADFAQLRDEHGPFVPVELPGMFGEPLPFHAVVSHHELVEISKQPHLFCSGKGSISIQDMPAEALEFFGSFITMDDPRHARLRAIVGRAFTPKRLEQVIDSVDSICAELIDGICEKGEIDFVEEISAPFPLLVICDMMGIPRSEFGAVLDATNIILGAGDPEMLGGREPMGAMFEAGITLTGLMSDLAEKRRKEPTDDLTSALVHANVDGESLTNEELGPFFILLAVAGNDTTRTATSLGMHFLGEHPDQRRIWQDDIEGVTPTAVEEIVRYASPVTFMRRTATQSVTVSGQQFDEGDKVVLFYGAANRDPKVFDDPDTFDVRRNPNPHVGFGGPGPHFCLGAHLARREISIVFRQLFTRLPDIDPSGPPAYLEANTIPLVGGVKHLPVTFTPTAPRS
ncbi:MAG TPA: cytochrome P450 [Acidimicrobiales bacterium]|jgi:methyl-branched lipid omega-hydroxylase|nr:cytochrome P450 [Acidimicrobiales bacterium]